MQDKDKKEQQAEAKPEVPAMPSPGATPELKPDDDSKEEEQEETPEPEPKSGKNEDKESKNTPDLGPFSMWIEDLKKSAEAASHLPGAMMGLGGFIGEKGKGLWDKIAGSPGDTPDNGKDLQQCADASPTASAGGGSSGSAADMDLEKGLMKFCKGFSDDDKSKDITGGVMNFIKGKGGSDKERSPGEEKMMNEGIKMAADMVVPGSG